MWLCEDLDCSVHTPSLWDSKCAKSKTNKNCVRWSKGSLHFRVLERVETHSRIKITSALVKFWSKRGKFKIKMFSRFMQFLIYWYKSHSGCFRALVMSLSCFFLGQKHFCLIIYLETFLCVLISDSFYKNLPWNHKSQSWDILTQKKMSGDAWGYIS